MSYKTPAAVARAGVTTGVSKAKLSRDKALVGGFLEADGRTREPAPARR